MPRIVHGRCPTCGRTSQLNWHTLSKSMVLTLARFMFYNEAREVALTTPFRVDEVGLEYKKRCNAQKLQYWGLVEVVRPTRRSRSGVWRVTPLGVAFMRGSPAGRVQHQVSTYDGQTRTFSGVRITCLDVDWGWATYAEFRAEQTA